MQSGLLNAGFVHANRQQFEIPQVEYPKPAQRGLDDNVPLAELGFCGPPAPQRRPPSPGPPLPHPRGGGLILHDEWLRDLLDRAQDRCRMRELTSAVADMS